MNFPAAYMQYAHLYAAAPHLRIIFYFVEIENKFKIEKLPKKRAREVHIMPNPNTYANCVN
jgi:hypothetical protein